MIEKNKEAQSQSLGELQQELKSLKALLLSRSPATPSMPSISGLQTKPSIPAWQLAGGDSRSTTPPTPVSFPGLNGKGKEAELGDTSYTPVQ